MNRFHLFAFFGAVASFLYAPVVFAHDMDGLFLNVMAVGSLVALLPAAWLIFLGRMYIRRKVTPWFVALLVFSFLFIFICSVISLVSFRVGERGMWVGMLYLMLVLGNIIWIAYTVRLRNREIEKETHR